MGILDDAAGEGQADAPPAPLGGGARLEQGAAKLLGTPGPSSMTRIAPICPSAPIRRMIAPGLPCSASIAFFTNDSSAHSSSTASPRTVGPGTGCFHAEVDHVGMPGQPGSVVPGDPVRQRTQPDRLPLGRIADPLESLGYPVEPFRIGAQMVGQVRRRR